MRVEGEWAGSCCTLLSCLPATPSGALMENHRGIFASCPPSVLLGGRWRGVTCSLQPMESTAFTVFVSQAEVGQWHIGGYGNCPAAERCLCIGQHKESFQWAPLSFRAFVSWEFIVAGVVQCLAVQSFYHRKILGELDSEIRTVWPFLRRGAACTDFWYENSWFFQ